MTVQTKETNKKLPKITLIYSLMDEFKEEATLHVANVYSYMLCKYNWFSSNSKDYFETQETIADGCRVSLSAAKVAIRFLIKHKLITVDKVKGKEFNKNKYTVVDRYGVYVKKETQHGHHVKAPKATPKPARHNFLEDVEDDDLPW